MSKKWSKKAIKAAITAAFSQLGYPTVKPEQLEAARGFVKGRHVLVVIPTGRGKSLCYGCLPLVYDTLRGTASMKKAIVVVMSSLKAQMLDQVCPSAKALQSVYVSAEDEGRETGKQVEWRLLIDIYEP